MIDRDELEVHLATCAECAGDLARYREVLAAVGSLRDADEEPPPEFAQRVVAHVASREPLALWMGRVLSAAHDERVHVAAASLGGALVGAGAIALLWWRAARRPVLGNRVAV